VVPLKNSEVHPGEPDLLASRAAVPAGRNEENWFPRKKVQCIPASPISWHPGLRSEPEGARETGSLEKKCSGPPASLISWLPGLRVRTGRNEENWFPRKKVQWTPGDPDLLASSAAVPAGRNEENWFPRKTGQCIPASPISRLPWRRSRREGMRKSGSVEKEYGDSPAALTSWFPGRGSEPRGMSKSGSCKENVPASFFVAELQGLSKSPARGRFRERPKS
jgi:hypothetical protein